jgi:hypothetical protein
MARCWRGSGCAVVLGVLAIAPAAGAQGAGIQVDRNSPSATEYQLPLERARQDAQQAGPPQRVRPGARSAPAFGEGITTPATRAKPPQREGRDTRRAKQRTSHDTTAAAQVAARRPSSTAVGGPGSSLLAVGAIAAGVLALGAAIGLLLRRRGRAG